ncbi:Pimeloyl-ACP methyl ester carboxylesterase [Lentzea xinjiangensis]|uniref:Pimeloyl-ACP methyl ester carboxylesterase n=2 Tax=Lentzea xinjiangensis TaxID=402600 RepID=A0A1H9V157_9PSEU|nr:alpha/beta hydrolase [Lentzea xinjiangensis]SES15329.1 Pimeloyl-ACP methyl ester carboxylesterase [Lentzea xinjiangensis]
MTIAFVNGVPATPAVWTPLINELPEALRRRVVLLGPPAFGAPVPPGFNATFDEYRDWLVDELSRLDSPVDLVGQSLGGGFVLEVAMTRPDLIRSWVSDTVGGYEPDYTWHEIAKVWQTPGDGERNVEQLFSGDASERAARMVEWGIPEPTAGEVALEQGQEMGKAILSLYRSVPQQVLLERGRDLPAAAARPGLVPIPTEDFSVGSTALRRRAAGRAGAHAAELDGIGHWWMLDDPARAARMLIDFWNIL